MEIIQLLEWFQTLDPATQDTLGLAVTTFAGLFLASKILPQLGFESSIFYYFTRALKSYSTDKESWAQLGLFPVAVFETLLAASAYPVVALFVGTSMKQIRRGRAKQEAELLPLHVQKLRLDLDKQDGRVSALEAELVTARVDKAEAERRAERAETQLAMMSTNRPRKRPTLRPAGYEEHQVSDEVTVMRKGR